MSWCGLFCDDKINVTETGQGNELAWDVSLVYPIVHSKASTYADDSGTGVKGSSAIEIIPKLEEDGENFLKYIASNGLVANPSKTALLFLNNKVIGDPIEIKIGPATKKFVKTIPI